MLSVQMNKREIVPCFRNTILRGADLTHTQTGVGIKKDFDVVLFMYWLNSCDDKYIDLFGSNKEVIPWVSCSLFAVLDNHSFPSICLFLQIVMLNI